MKDAGYKNIHHERLKLPIGTWPKDKYLVSIYTFSKRTEWTSLVHSICTRLTIELL